MLEQPIEPAAKDEVHAENRITSLIFWRYGGR